ncbi:methionine adenosyltransferase domain-containing protein [Candidatus Woesearchaeota archaeon]|nr:methionine adenosyltransferase domain-containing protein [Candidatus Woesearchaeota archaeon]
METAFHSFEAGRRAKPDELETGIAELIGASLLERDPFARFDLRVSGKYHRHQPLVGISGEVSMSVLDKEYRQDIARIVREHYRCVHRAPDATVRVRTHFKPQEIKLAGNRNAGDSGVAIGLAIAYTPYNLPIERFLAVEIRDVIDQIYHHDGKIPDDLASRSGVSRLEGLRADGKVEVNFLYERGRINRHFPKPLDLTIAVEHEEQLSLEELRHKLALIVKAIYQKNISGAGKEDLPNKSILINGLGPWHEGGWKVDEGSREAKSYRDGFATWGVAEDSFSGEDPTKISATGTFLARYIALEVIALELADVAKVTLQYRIGQEQPAFLNIDTEGTFRNHRALSGFIEMWKRQDLSIPATIERFGLRDPQLYRQITEASDFFHNPKFPWNKVDDKRHKS